MSEFRMNEVFAVGRIFRGPVKTADGRVQFLLEASESQTPFHCVCSGKAAENVLEFCNTGDEISLEGELCWLEFTDTGKSLVIEARYVSYGRKLRTRREGAVG